MARRTARSAAAALGLAAAAAAQGAAEEPVLLVPMLRNGDFAEAAGAGAPAIPWWIAGGPGGVVEQGPDGPELVLEGDRASVRQPVPAYAPLCAGAVLRGRFRGLGELSVYGGATAAYALEANEADPYDFELVLADAPAVVGELRPRLIVQLSGRTVEGVPARARWSRLELLVPLPCPSEAALRAEVEGHLQRIFGAVLAVGLDDVGPRATPFRAFGFDARDGARLGPPERRVGDVALHELLLAAWRASPRPEWEAALVAFVEAYLDLCVHPDTGLERRYDPVADAPADDEPVEIHRGLAFLLDVADHGPEALRARAFAAAERMARGALARGVLPDGEVAALYRPSDGRPFFDVPRLRRLDVPAQLARVAAATEDQELARRCLRAAEEACLTLAYDHYWPGDWNNIDPGFDDNYGHYGARAATMWEAHPESSVFRSIVTSGWARYAPLWRDALRFGGNVAADQVRCWRIAIRAARLEPALAPEVERLCRAAVHAHLQGEQLPGGAWIDTTVKNFAPVDLPVGDTGGVPQNLLEGLAVCYGAEDLDLADDGMRARFTAVLRTTVAELGLPHGFAERRGASVEQPVPGLYGSIRVAVGLVEMLEALAR